MKKRKSPPPMYLPRLWDKRRRWRWPRPKLSPSGGVHFGNARDLLAATGAERFRWRRSLVELVAAMRDIVGEGKARPKRPGKRALKRSAEPPEGARV